jgi:hypothetical protein
MIWFPSDEAVWSGTESTDIAIMRDTNSDSSRNPIDESGSRKEAVKEAEEALLRATIADSVEMIQDFPQNDKSEKEPDSVQARLTATGSDPSSISVLRKYAPHVT